ncbi:MAG: DegV family EDD domain-containing protein [Acidimicrobiales bacterium]|nr:DegV family EDD domain-containing protein [Acidimicrobiales bacterium]
MTDSAAALPAEVVEHHGIRVVPLWLSIGDERHRDGEIDLDEVVRRFAEPISTAAPSPGEFATAIAAARRSGPVLVLTVASRMSSSYDSARLGAKLVADEFLGDRAPGATDARDGGPEVAVVDTGTAAGAQAQVVLAAARAASDGAGLATVVAVAEQVAARVRLVATVSDLERLARSGRVPEAARRIGDRLGVRPLFEFRDGRARPLRPAFSAAAARERIVQRCGADSPDGHGSGGRLHATVLHALDPDAAADLVARLEPLHPASCVVGPFSPVMVVHTGRGLAGLAWWWQR